MKEGVDFGITIYEISDFFCSFLCFMFWTVLWSITKLFKRLASSFMHLTQKLNSFLF
jgi:hypothetical protein